MSTYKEYTKSFYREYEDRIIQNVDTLKDKVDLSVFQNFKDMLFKNITGNKQGSEVIDDAFEYAFNKIGELENVGVPKLSIADLYGWFGKLIHSVDMHNDFQPCLYRKAYDLYVELKDFHGIVNCGSSLFVGYIGPWTLSAEDREDAITIMKTCLDAIEEKEGKGNSYCYFINDCTMFNLLSSKECQKYLPEFLSDFPISNIDHGEAYYQQLCSAIAAVLRTNDNLSEEEDHFWRSNYDK